MKRIVTAFVVAMAAAAGTAVQLAPEAAAADRNGVCDAGEFCYYYNSGQKGSVSDHSGSLGNYGTKLATCYVFKSEGRGKGMCIKNNAASVWNRTNQPVTIYFNSKYGGRTQVIQPGAKANLVQGIKNNNASHRIGAAEEKGPKKNQPPPPPNNNNGQRTTMSRGLYGSGGRLSCAFDGYRSTPGRHEGIDFFKGSGAPIHSLTEGTVIRVVTGSNSSMSMIAIYQQSTDRTIIYLHSVPGVREGQQVSRGTRIGTEASRGNGGTHTHVEMRPGRRTSAAKSVGDYNLENPNPTSYWASQGYTIA